MYGTCFHSAIHLFYSIFLFLICEIRGIFENKAIVMLSLMEVESNGSCKTAGKLISGILSMITESNNINVNLSSTALSIGWFSVFSAT